MTDLTKGHEMQIYRYPKYRLTETERLLAKVMMVVG
jgi:hypothetical protein